MLGIFKQEHDFVSSVTFCRVLCIRSRIQRDKPQPCPEHLHESIAQLPLTNEHVNELVKQLHPEAIGVKCDTMHAGSCFQSSTIVGTSGSLNLLDNPEKAALHCMVARRPRRRAHP